MQQSERTPTHGALQIEDVSGGSEFSASHVPLPAHFLSMPNRVGAISHRVTRRRSGGESSSTTGVQAGMAITSPTSATGSTAVVSATDAVEVISACGLEDVGGEPSSNRNDWAVPLVSVGSSTGAQRQLMLSGMEGSGRDSYSTRQQQQQQPLSRHQQQQNSTVAANSLQESSSVSSPRMRSFSGRDAALNFSANADNSSHHFSPPLTSAGAPSAAPQSERELRPALGSAHRLHLKHGWMSPHPHHFSSGEKTFSLAHVGPETVSRSCSPSHLQNFSHQRNGETHAGSTETRVPHSLVAWRRSLLSEDVGMVLVALLAALALLLVLLSVSQRLWDGSHDSVDPVLVATAQVSSARTVSALLEFTQEVFRTTTSLWGIQQSVALGSDLPASTGQFPVPPNSHCNHTGSSCGNTSDRWYKCTVSPGNGTNVFAAVVLNLSRLCTLQSSSAYPSFVRAVEVPNHSGQLPSYFAACSSTAYGTNGSNTSCSNATVEGGPLVFQNSLPFGRSSGEEVAATNPLPVDGVVLVVTPSALAPLAQPWQDRFSLSHATDTTRAFCHPRPGAPLVLGGGAAPSAATTLWERQGKRLLVEIVVVFSAVFLLVASARLGLLRFRDALLQCIEDRCELLEDVAVCFGDLKPLDAELHRRLASASDDDDVLHNWPSVLQAQELLDVGSAVARLEDRQRFYRSFLPSGLLKAAEVLGGASIRRVETALSPRNHPVESSVSGSAHSSPHLPTGPSNWSFSSPRAFAPRRASGTNPLQPLSDQPVQSFAHSSGELTTEESRVAAAAAGVRKGGGGEMPMNARHSFELTEFAAIGEDAYDGEVPNLNEYEELMVSVGLPGAFSVAEYALLQQPQPSGAHALPAHGGSTLENESFAWPPPSLPPLPAQSGTSATGGGAHSVRAITSSLFLSPNATAAPTRKQRPSSTALHSTFESVTDFNFVSPNVTALVPPTAPVISVFSPNATPFTEASGGSPLSHRGGGVGATDPLEALQFATLEASGTTPVAAAVSAVPTPATASIAPLASLASPSDRRISGTTNPTFRRTSNNNDNNPALHPSEAADRRISALSNVGDVNYMAHSGIRRVTFVSCHVFFPSAPHAVPVATPASAHVQPFATSSERLAHLERACKLFLSIAKGVCEEFQGVTYRMTLTSVVMTFNAFEPCPFHESRGCLAALHMAKELQEKLESDASFLAASGKWGICVNSGASVVGIAGTTQKMSPVVVSDALTLAISATRLCTMIRSQVLVLEPAYNAARTQVFCVPVDIVGQEGAQIIVFELKGSVEDFKAHAAEYQSTMDGFACMVVHKFDDAERFLQGSTLQDHTTTRLLEFVRWCKRVECTGSQLLSKPYRRCVPLWDSPELLAEQEELDDELKDKILQHRALLFGGGVTATGAGSASSRPRLSILAETFLRQQLDRHPSVDTGGTGLTNFSPFGAEAIWSRRTSVDVTGSRKSSNDQSTASASPVDGSRATLLPVSGPVIPVEVMDRKNQLWMRTDRLLGQGSFGAVYQGLAESGALVAMKVLPLNAAELRAYRAQAPPANGGQKALPPHIEEVLKETQLLSQLVHPNVVQYHTTAIASSYLFIMMEFMSGGNLTKMVQMFGALPVAVIRRFSKDILEGLAFLHSKQIVHRDINPNNVLLSLEGTCKLSDFGAAAGTLQRRGADAARQRRLSKEEKETQSSSSFGTPAASPIVRSLVSPLPPGAGIDDKRILGTPLFMAPEACRGAATTASDIWGFGIILCFCFSGQYPYPEADYQDVDAFLARLGMDEGYGPTIPDEVRQHPAAASLVEDCLQRQEDKRPSAAELLLKPFFLH